MKKKNKDISQSLHDLDNQARQLQIEKDLVLQKAFSSNNADAIFKAQEYVKNIETKQDSHQKSMFIDPSGVLTGGGYLDKGFTISYDVLRRMSTIPIIKAILETRKEQILSFCEPQKDKYSPGFIIRPKNFDETKDLNRNQSKRVDELTEFILDCGDNGSLYHGDNFNSFTRKFIGDSLCLDQGTAELVYNRKGELTEFIATDGASYRIADSHNDTIRDNEKMKKGYLPYYVQLYNGTIYAEFYPWELIFAIRNPQTSIYSNGYGKSELEDLVGSVTSLINADTYNANYFKVGSNPKGILKISGNINGSRLEEFRNQWTSQVAGVRNCLHADTLIWTKQFGGLEIENTLRGEEKQNVDIWTGTQWQKAEIFKTEPKQVCITRSNNGAEIKTSPDHLFAIVNNEGEFDWRKQKDLQLGDILLVNKKSLDVENLNIPKFKNKDLDENILEILGWMIGDGSLFYKDWDRIERKSIGKIFLYFHYEKELDILNRYKETLSAFGLSVQEKHSDLSEDQREKIARKYKFKTVSRKHYYLQICNKEFVKYLIDDLGFQTSSDGKVIPESIFKMPESLRGAFLRGLFSADGNREGQYGARITIASSDVRNQTKNLLLSLGIRTANCESGKIKKQFGGLFEGASNFLTIRDNAIFVEKVGFLQDHKKPTKEIPSIRTNFNVEAIKKYLGLARKSHKENSIFSTRELGDLNSISNGFDPCSLERLIKFLDKANIKYPRFWNDYHFEKVIQLDTSVDFEPMYDVEVFDNVHAFVANGLIVHNSHKLPVIEADKMDFINTQASNKDMEFAHFQEYLIKLMCASYKIDPSEIGFPMSGSSDAKPMFEGSNESRLKYSKDKGLKPLLKFYQHYVNKYILSIKDPNYEFVFVGLDAETPEQELEKNIKEVSNYKTVNEVRASAGLEKIQGGDIILNPIFFQAQMAQQQGNQESNDNVEQQGEEPNPFMDDQDTQEEDPFLKAITEETNRYFEIN